MFMAHGRQGGRSALGASFRSRWPFEGRSPGACGKEAPVPDKPITLGSMILTLVEPHPGHAVAYNRWYEDDHLYAILLGPGAIAGGRFVARGEDKARRRAAGAGDRSAGSLLAGYWLVGHGEVPA